ncbi:MAG: hypothetical protein QOF39_2347, partial [Frankiales bacterium]|nr:hypothetical protein [Frankiales bacterium]
RVVRVGLLASMVTTRSFHQWG